jgi:hypothetical protein
MRLVSQRKEQVQKIDGLLSSIDKKDKNNIALMVRSLNADLYGITNHSQAS